LSRLLALGSKIEAAYIPGDLNLVADFLSRHSLAALRTHPALLALLHTACPFALTVDRFADAHNHVLPHYNTYYPHRVGAPVDAFS
jgi:hypothetical protein